MGKRLFIISFLIALSGALSAQDEGVTPFRVHISSDRLSFTENQPADISVSIKNISGRTASFKIYDVSYTTFQPVVYGMDGREAETKVSYRLRNRTTQQTVEYIEPRTASIGANEKIMKRLDLTEYYELETGKDYRIKLFFLPDAGRPDVISSDNSLVIHINPSEREMTQNIELPEKHHGNITPSEAVLLALSAERSKHWSDMLKFYDLEKFISAYPDYAQSYNSGSAPIRKRVLRDFASYLSTPRADYIVDFEIRSESILDDRKTAVVDTRVTRNASPRPYQYMYRYTLEQSNGSWYISGVDVTVSKERAISR
jgi:hypothetical protein